MKNIFSRCKSICYVSIFSASNNPPCVFHAERGDGFAKNAYYAQQIVHCSA